MLRRKDEKTIYYFDAKNTQTIDSQIAFKITCFLTEKLMKLALKMSDFVSKDFLFLLTKQCLFYSMGVLFN